MNKVVLMGRLTRDPEVRYSQGENPLAIARYTLAVDRRMKKEGEPNADFISCISFGRTAEFAEKYFRQGLRITICGRIQTGSYTNRDGQKVYTTEVVVEEQEFAESKSAQSGNSPHPQQQSNQPAGNNSYPQQGNQQSGGSRPQQGNGYQSGYQGNNPQHGGGSYGMGDDGWMNIPEGLDDELPFN